MIISCMLVLGFTKYEIIAFVCSIILHEKLNIAIANYLLKDSKGYIIQIIEFKYINICCVLHRKVVDSEFQALGEIVAFIINILMFKDIVIS